MVITSLQVCMDSSNWLQGTIHEEAGLMDDSSSPSGDILTCSRPLIERRLRPPHDLALKCPRCDSPNTKFCYYNNYSLSQPRYFCKTCRRYWTKGGTLRNIPVGGGCRKNKKVSSSKKPNNDLPLHHHQTANKNLGSSSSSSNPTDLQLSNFQETAHQFSQFSHFLGDHVGGGLFSNPSSSNNFMLENPTPIDFMDNKYEALVGCTSRNQDFVLGNGHHDDLSMISAYNHDINSYQTGLVCSTFGMSMDGNNNNNNFGTLMDNSNQRLMLPNYETQEGQQCSIDVKPNPKMLSLEWHDQQGCSNAGKESFGYLNGGLGSWTGLMNGYGSSATNPLV